MKEEARQVKAKSGAQYSGWLETSDALVHACSNFNYCCCLSYLLHSLGYNCGEVSGAAEKGEEKILQQLSTVCPNRGQSFGELVVGLGTGRGFVRSVDSIFGRASSAETN